MLYLSNCILTIVDPLLSVDIPPEIPPRLLRLPSIEDEVSTLQEVETRMGHILFFFTIKKLVLHAMQET